MHVRVTKSVSQADLLDVYPGSSVGKADFLNDRIKTNSVFLAQGDDVNLGFLIYSIWWGDCPFIEYLKVKEEFRRRGVGEALLKAVIEEIKSKGHVELVSSTKTNNDMGLSFHKKIGFKPLNSLVLPDGEEQFFTLKI